MPFFVYGVYAARYPGTMPPHRRTSLLPVALSALAAGAVLAVASPASAAEGEAPEYRDDGPYLLVCGTDEAAFTERNTEVSYTRRVENVQLFEECVADGYRDLAEAVAVAGDSGVRVRILPGDYVVDQTVVVDGLANVQIEGLGDGPEDVRLSAGYDADAIIDVRGAEGLYLKGFTVTQSSGDGLRLDGVDGAALDGLAAVHNAGDGIRVASSTAVEVADCLAEGNYGAGVALDDTDAAVTGCESTGNLIGIAETGGGAVTVETNRLQGNTTGLVVADTTEGHRLEATGNLVGDNNAEHYGALDSAACEGPLGARDWSGGVLCPTESAPSGVGILVDQANDTRFAVNHIWGQDTAAAMVWGETGIDDESSNRNRFEGNTLGYRDDGQRSRNRVGLWWDGQGEGNCFDEPSADHTTPAVLPSCSDEIGPGRILGEPLKTFKTWHCGTGAVDGDVPAGCDWFGAKFTDRLEFQAVVVFAAALLFLTGAGWLGAARSPNPPPPMSMTFSAIATGFAALLWILAAWSGRSDYEALAIGLWGFGWILAGRSWFSAGLHAFGGFTALIGGLAVLDAIDRGAWIVPVVPVSPAWMWLVLLPLWLLLALGALFRHYDSEPASPPVQRTPTTVPVRDRFDW